MIQEFFEKESEKQRKIKQDFLRKNIIDENFNPEEFYEFITNEKVDGQNVDNWSMDQLESIVLNFKKNAKNQPDDKHQLQNQLEKIELDDNQDLIYYNRLTCQQKKNTFFSEKKFVDSGYFGQKQLNFNITIPLQNLSIKRNEKHFKWLVEILSLEFPMVILPPLVMNYDKYIDEITMRQIKLLCEKFLNEILKHNLLRNSQGLELFLLEENMKLFEKQKKEVKKLILKQIQIKTNLTKKQFDQLEYNPLLKYQTSEKYIEMKQSPQINQYYESFNNQTRDYENILNKIELVCKDYQKCSSKMISINQRFKDGFAELQSCCFKNNIKKTLKNQFNLIEDQIFATLSTQFEKFSSIFTKQMQIYQENINNFAVYLKEYMKNTSQKIKERYQLQQEYLQNKNLLNEKKLKKLIGDNSTLNIDYTQIKNIILTEKQKENPLIIRKLIFPEETKKLRMYSDFYSFFNYSIFKELQQLEKYIVMSLLGNMRVFAERSADNLTNNHIIFAEILTDVNEIQKVLQNKNFLQFILYIIFNQVKKSPPSKSSSSILSNPPSQPKSPNSKSPYPSSLYTSSSSLSSSSSSSSSEESYPGAFLFLSQRIQVLFSSKIFASRSFISISSIQEQSKFQNGIQGYKKFIINFLLKFNFKKLQKLMYIVFILMIVTNICLGTKLLYNSHRKLIKIDSQEFQQLFKNQQNDWRIFFDINKNDDYLYQKFLFVDEETLMNIYFDFLNDTNENKKENFFISLKNSILQKFLQIKNNKGLQWKQELQYSETFSEIEKLIGFIEQIMNLQFSEKLLIRIDNLLYNLVQLLESSQIIKFLVYEQDRNVDFYYYFNFKNLEEIKRHVKNTFPKLKNEIQNKENDLLIFENFQKQLEKILTLKKVQHETFLNSNEWKCFEVIDSQYYQEIEDFLLNLKNSEQKQNSVKMEINKNDFVMAQNINEQITSQSQVDQNQDQIEQQQKILIAKDSIITLLLNEFLEQTKDQSEFLTKNFEQQTYQLVENINKLFNEDFTELESCGMDQSLQIQYIYSKQNFNNFIEQLQVLQEQLKNFENDENFGEFCKEQSQWIKDQLQNKLLNNEIFQKQENKVIEQVKYIKDYYKQENNSSQISVFNQEDQNNENLKQNSSQKMKLQKIQIVIVEIVKCKDCLNYI